MSSAGAIDRVEAPAGREAPGDAVGPIVDGSVGERSRLGGITIDMMSVGAGAAVNVALGADASPVTLGVVVLVPVLVVATAVEAGTGVMDDVGSEIAPEVALKGVPGGGGGGPVVVVAMVEGDVDGVVAAFVGADCASAGPAMDRRIAAAAASVPGLTAIGGPG